MKTLFIFAILVISQTVMARDVQCQHLRQSIGNQSQMFQFVENSATFRTYYGSISTKKTGPIFKVFLTQSCVKNKSSAYLIRFQTLAKTPQESKAKLFYCYSKVMIQANGFWKDNGTFCKQTTYKNIPNLSFPYERQEDPYYSQANDGMGADEVGPEFPQSNRTGLNDRFDPYFDSYSNGNQYGPDSRDYPNF